MTHLLCSHWTKLCAVVWVAFSSLPLPRIVLACTIQGCYDPCVHFWSTAATRCLLACNYSGSPLTFRTWYTRSAPNKHQETLTQTDNCQKIHELKYLGVLPCLAQRQCAGTTTRDIGGNNVRLGVRSSFLPWAALRFQMRTPTSRSNPHPLCDARDEDPVEYPLTFRTWSTRSKWNEYARRTSVRTEDASFHFRSLLFPQT